MPVLNAIDKLVIGQRQKNTTNKVKMIKDKIEEKIFGKPRNVSLEEMVGACYEIHPEAF